MKIWNKITNEPWATTSDTLENIINIAQRQNANPAAIAAQLGRKLQNTYAVSIRNNVAIIPIRGPLFRYANIFTAISGATSYELLARDFNSALVDESVKAILFDIDSPGGEVNGCSELADMIYNDLFYYNRESQLFRFRQRYYQRFDTNYYQTVNYTTVDEWSWRLFGLCDGTYRRYCRS